jgi:hypothetical protein
MSELPPDEPSIATAGAARIAELTRSVTHPVAERRRAFARISELTRSGTHPLAERRRAFDCERKRRGSAKALPAESQRAPPPPELRNQRLGARNGDEPAVRTSVKPSIPTNDNLIDRTRVVRLCRPGQSMFKQSTDKGGCK